jgi:hypothetical protein
MGTMHRIRRRWRRGHHRIGRLSHLSGGFWHLGQLGGWQVWGSGTGYSTLVHLSWMDPIPLPPNGR